MKKLLVLSAVFLLPAAAALAQPYTTISYRYTGSSHVVNEPGYGKLVYRNGSGEISMPALLFSVESSDGLFLVRTEALKNFKDGFEKDALDYNAGKADYVSDRYTLNLNDLKTYYADMAGLQVTEIGEGFSVFRVPFRQATAEKAKNLTYPKIFAKDKAQFEKTFNYKMGSGYALQKSLLGYSDTALGYVIQGQPKGETKYALNAYTFITDDYNRNRMPALMLDKNGTFLFIKKDYDQLIKNVNYWAVINLDMLQTHYSINASEKMADDGRYYILKTGFKPETLKKANDLDIPRIFSDAQAQEVFKTKFGQPPDSALEKFVKNNISASAYIYLKGAQQAATPDFAQELKKRNTEENRKSVGKKVGGIENK
ncbi:MAG: hypothetical protein LBI01_04930 [Elusimicrobium sp.]|jgi:hypothetical protein|nr:hypothetical protein [Elusimicrobium sp.]